MEFIIFYSKKPYQRVVHKSIDTLSKDRELLEGMTSVVEIATEYVQTIALVEKAVTSKKKDKVEPAKKTKSLVKPAPESAYQKPKTKLDPNVIIQKI